MCGICGLASLDGITPVDAGKLAEMNATLEHRGPDSSGSFSDGPVGLAARRLAIVDLAGGDQPVSNENGRVTVVHNGEIYNAAGLRAELEGRGHRFATRCDTEVLVHLYEHEGPQFVRRLRGMFAVALWDAGEQRLLLARDRFGIKPLYWSLQAGQLAFASELKALRRAPGFSTEIDLDAVEAFLAFNSIPGPRTIFRSARKLGAGHLLLWRAGASEPVVECFADPRPVPADRVRSEPFDVLADELRERLRDSVRAHLVADVEVGVLLSGGVDSAALAALAAQETVGGRISTFSIRFRERSFD
ncbi:MAG: asparagine synthase (glutamine-hydrolyzing), partial [Solirubrobacterales bacterium]|nr:asparagine synthase (glutamine-hydrolyzing) [Solirubrobacterales bacterium]